MATARIDAQRRPQANPGSGDARRNLNRFLSLSAALLALLSCPAWAAKWEVVPTLSIVETYTDNVSLAPDASKRSDWVSQVIPGISTTATGPRLKFNATYAPEVTYYARGNRDNQVYHRGNATGSAELAQQLLFVDAGTRIDQINVSLQGPLTTSNVYTTGNRTRTTTSFLSPYLLHNFGTAVRTEARFTYSVARSDLTSVLSDSEANRVNLRLASGPAYKLLTWDFAYSKESIKYESQQETDTEVITANARRLITPTVGLLSTVGYESYDYRIGQAAKESLWSAGLDWTPTSRTHLAATAGHRLYGNSYSLDFRHRTRLTTWSAGYSESITSTRAEFFVPMTMSTAAYLDQLFLSQFPDPQARQKAVEQFIALTGLPPSLSVPLNFLSNRQFVVKRWQASAGILGVRNTLIANVFKETRDSLVDSAVLPSTGDFAASNTVVQTGTSLLWNWRMTAQNAWNMSAAYSRNEFPGTGQIDNVTSVGTGVTRQFQPRLSGSLNYRRQQNDSNQSAASFTENAVFATVRVGF